jgi:hypothetical protein
MRNCLLVSWSSGLYGEANEHLALVGPGVPAFSHNESAIGLRDFVK